MRLNKSHKDKVIGGIIGIIILILTLYIEECFEKRSPKPDPQQTNNSTSIKSEDSSTQTIIQSPQSNSNIGNVSNEYIGTKNVTQYQAPQTNSSKRGKKQPEINIEGNNGSNINVAPVSGDLTQIVNNHQPRNLSKEQIAEILSSIPVGYTVEIRFPSIDQEADGFSDQVMDLLSGSDRKVFKTRHHNIVTATGKDFDIKPYPDKTDVMILTVYPQK
jgi:hypothetical protein